MLKSFHPTSGAPRYSLRLLALLQGGAAPQPSPAPTTLPQGRFIQGHAGTVRRLCVVWTLYFLIVPVPTHHYFVSLFRTDTLKIRYCTYLYTYIGTDSVNGVGSCLESRSGIMIRTVFDRIRPFCNTAYTQVNQKKPVKCSLRYSDVTRHYSKEEYMQSSVADTDLYVFGPPGFGSGSVSQRNGSGSFYPQAKIVR